MTNAEYKEKYPIGTKIRFIANESMCHQAKQDDGKTGKIIGETSCGNVMIFLIDSVKGDNGGYTWNTEWKNIKPFVAKNEQLSFDFMYSE